MKVYSQLEYASLQNSASDLTGVAGLVYYNTGTTFPKYYSAAWHTFADTDSAQAFTNKDYDGGTASNTSRLTVPKDTKANLDGLTRKEGTLVYATDEDKLYADDGTNLVEVGSGAVSTGAMQTTDVTAGAGAGSQTIASGNTLTYPYVEISAKPRQ